MLHRICREKRDSNSEGIVGFPSFPRSSQYWLALPVAILCCADSELGEESDQPCITLYDRDQFVMQLRWLNGGTAYRIDCTLPQCLRESVMVTKKNDERGY